MHFLPWKLLRKGLRAGGAKSGPEPRIVLSDRVFRLLVEAALSAQPFNEKAYLALHADVETAIARGEWPSGRAHYLAVGYYEGRATGRSTFDEAWYLNRYPDVLAAVRRGDSRSGSEHFGKAGALEWRSPHEAAEADIARWHSAIKPPRQAAKKKEAAPEKTKVLRRSIRIVDSHQNPAVR